MRVLRWRDVAGTRWACCSLPYTLNRHDHRDLTYRDVWVANPVHRANAFDVPADQLATAAKPADPRITPFHWASGAPIRLRFYMAVDNQYCDKAPTHLGDINP